MKAREGRHERDVRELLVRAAGAVVLAEPMIRALAVAGAAGTGDRSFEAPAAAAAGAAAATGSGAGTAAGTAAVAAAAGGTAAAAGAAAGDGDNGVGRPVQRDSAGRESRRGILRAGCRSPARPEQQPARRTALHSHRTPRTRVHQSLWLPGQMRHQLATIRPAPAGAKTTWPVRSCGFLFFPTDIFFADNSLLACEERRFAAHLLPPLLLRSSSLFPSLGLDGFTSFLEQPDFCSRLHTHIEANFHPSLSFSFPTFLLLFLLFFLFLPFFVSFPFLSSFLLCFALRAAAC
jgi:hypothetical protein